MRAKVTRTVIRRRGGMTETSERMGGRREEEEVRERRAEVSEGSRVRRSFATTLHERCESAQSDQT